MTRTPFILAALALVAGACSSPAPETASETTAPSASTTSAVPADIAAAATAAVPGLSITGGEMNNAQTQYEVTGTMPNGDEVELDLAQVNGAWTVEEIQRDVAWASVPDPVRTAAASGPKTFEPVRVIESKHPDGSIVYELFAAPGQDGSTSRGPAMEVRWHNEKAEVVP